MSTLEVHYTAYTLVQHIIHSKIHYKANRRQITIRQWSITYCLSHTTEKSTCKFPGYLSLSSWIFPMGCSNPGLLSLLSKYPLQWWAREYWKGIPKIPRQHFLISWLFHLTSKYPISIISHWTLLYQKIHLWPGFQSQVANRPILKEYSGFRKWSLCIYKSTLQ